MNNKYIAQAIAITVLSATQYTVANENLVGETLPTVDSSIEAFDTKDAPEKKELTAEEQTKAQELQKQAVAIYNDILTYDTKSRAESVDKNLKYLEESLVVAQSRLKTEITNSKSLNKTVFKKKKQIDALEASQELKDKRYVELKEHYEQRKDSMDYAIEGLKKRILTLKERIAVYRGEKNDLNIINGEKGAKAEPTWAEKDKQRKDDAINTFGKIQDELIDKEYDKYLN